MQFLVIGLDGTDEKAMERRLTAREAHIKMGDELVKTGNKLYGAALLDEVGKMKGSAIFVDFPTTVELNEWLEKEPYVIGNVWKNITIHKCLTRDHKKFNRLKEFFLNKQK